MQMIVDGEPDNWKQLRPVRRGDAVLPEQSGARFLPSGLVQGFAITFWRATPTGCLA
jgi:hypothetical protein